MIWVLGIGVWFFSVAKVPGAKSSFGNSFVSDNTVKNVLISSSAIVTAMRLRVSCLHTISGLRWLRGRVGKTDYNSIEAFNSIVWTYSNCSKTISTRVKMEQVENEVNGKYFAECGEVPILPNSVGIAVVWNIVDKESSVLSLLFLTSVWTANFYPSMVVKASRHGQEPPPDSSFD